MKRLEYYTVNKNSKNTYLFLAVFFKLNSQSVLSWIPNQVGNDKLQTFDFQNRSLPPRHRALNS